MLVRSLVGRQMLASLIGVLAGACVGLMVMAALFWLRPPSSTLRAELQEEARDLNTGLQTDASGRVAVTLDSDDASIYDAMPKDAAYLILDHNGRKVAQSPDGAALESLLTMRPGENMKIIKSGGATLHLQVIEHQVMHGGQHYTVRVGRSDRLVTTLNSYAGELYLRSAIVTVLLALTTFMLVVYVTIRRLTKPLRESSEAATRLGPRNLSLRLRADGLPTEIVPLIDAFNAALDRLETGFRVQQEFLASAAHELKMPLALLQTEMELGETADTSSLLRETQLMARIVHQLLHLAEASEGHNYTFEPISLQAGLQETVHYLERLANQHSVRLQVEAEDAHSPLIEADRGAVFVLAKNLLENAIRYAPAGTTIRIHTSPHGFSVEDKGPGVAEENEPFLFQRFWRADRDDANGAGLGLTICREICHAHRWQIRYEPTPNPPGARFIVSIDAGGEMQPQSGTLPIIGAQPRQ